LKTEAKENKEEEIIFSVLVKDIYEDEENDYMDANLVYKKDLTGKINYEEKTFTFGCSIVQLNAGLRAEHSVDGRCKDRSGRNGSGEC
jgi:hypothetical protein